MVKVYLPSVPAVIASPFTVTDLTIYPSSGVTVTVTVSPALPEVLSACTVPWLDGMTSTLYTAASKVAETVVSPSTVKVYLPFSGSTAVPFTVTPVSA